jgi:hypothetical protein
MMLLVDIQSISFHVFLHNLNFRHLYRVYSTKKVSTNSFKIQAILCCKLVVGLVKDNNVVSLNRFEHSMDVIPTIAFVVVIL